MYNLAEHGNEHYRTRGEDEQSDQARPEELYDRWAYCRPVG